MFNSNNLISQIIFQGSIISWIVLGILLFMSIYSWGIIFYKFFSFKNTKHLNYHFFKTTKNLSITEKVSWCKMNKKSLNAKVVYQTSYDYSVIKNVSLIEKMTILEKSSVSYISKIMRNYEESLSILATISNVAPFIGLFGTVAGITISFHDIAEKGATSLAVVAPGISEALVATGVGLFAAIPASFFYNYFKNELRQFSNSMKQSSSDTLIQIIKQTQ